MLLLALPPWAGAQEDSDTPLGDVARSLRKHVASSAAVIDDDNLLQVMDDAESRHVAGSSPVFSLDPGGKSIHVSSPDVTCSLSFSAKAKSLLADPLVLDELPRSELAKLDGPATIDGDSLQVAMHNGTSWELREVLIGLTIIKGPDPVDAAASIGQARIIPAVSGSSPQPVQGPFEKQPDVTILLHVKGSAGPSATATFRTPLNFALFPDQEWHWAIVKAKGIPPPTPPELTTIVQSEATGQAAPAADSKIAPPAPSPSNEIPASWYTLPHR